MRRRGDDGVAALELGLLLTMMLALLGLVAPLGYLFYERVQLGRTTGDVMRFASSRTDRPRLVTPFTGSGPTSYVVPAQELPGSAAISAEASNAYTGRGTLTLPPVVVRTRDAGCPAGFRLTVTLTTQVDVSPFVSLVTAGSLSGASQTLSASASSCEE